MSKKKEKGSVAYAKQLEANRRWAERNPGRLAQACVDWRVKYPARYLLSRTKASAKRRGLAFDLAEADLGSLPTHCPVLGLELAYYGAEQAGLHNPAAASIDRINNSMGYIAGNVVIVSLRANVLKRDATPAELEAVARFYGALAP